MRVNTVFITSTNKVLLLLKFEDLFPATLSWCRSRGSIQVWCSLIQFLESSLRKRMQNYKYKIRYESEYSDTSANE